MIHAARMIAYLVDCDELVELATIEAPERSWGSVQQLFDPVFEMEKGVTASINRLYSRAEEAGENSAALPLLDQQFLKGSVLSTSRAALRNADDSREVSPNHSRMWFIAKAILPGAIAVQPQESKSRRFAILSVVWSLALAWLMALVVHQGGRQLLGS